MSSQKCQKIGKNFSDKVVEHHRLSKKKKSYVYGCDKVLSV